MAINKFRPNDPDSISINGGAALATGKAIYVADCVRVEWSILYTGTPTDGTVMIEWSPVDTYTGLWHQVPDAAITLDNITTDGKVGWGVYPAPIAGYLRARISEAVVGGTITVRLNGQLFDTVVTGGLS